MFNLPVNPNLFQLWFRRGVAIVAVCVAGYIAVVCGPCVVMFVVEVITTPLSFLMLAVGIAFGLCVVLDALAGRGAQRTAPFVRGMASLVREFAPVRLTRGVGTSVSRASSAAWAWVNMEKIPQRPRGQTIEDYIRSIHRVNEEN